MSLNRTPTRLPFVLLLFTLMFSTSVLAAPDQEYSIKAGFLYNFARFSSLAEGLRESQEFTLCSSDVGFVNLASQTLKQRNIKGHPVITRLVQPFAAPLKSCNALFITHKSTASWTPWLNQQPPEQPLLIVGETKEFIDQGGHISFFLAGTKVRFEVSPQSLKKSGIQISSKVLRLGRSRESDS